jgi:hypothetical protein
MGSMAADKRKVSLTITAIKRSLCRLLRMRTLFSGGKDVICINSLNVAKSKHHFPLSLENGVALARFEGEVET